MKKIIVGVTGASGAMIGERLIGHLLGLGHEVHVVMSTSGFLVFKEELGVTLAKEPARLTEALIAHLAKKKFFAGNRQASSRLHAAHAEDFAARISSGSSKIDAMVIAPCSMSTVGAIAHGVTLNLIHRSASVSIKEKRPLALVPRESPLSPIHLKNLLYLAEIGVHVVPATTAFYHHPKTVEEMVDFTVGRVLDFLKIEHHLIKRWKEGASE